MKNDLRKLEPTCWSYCEYITSTVYKMWRLEHKTRILDVDTTRMAENLTPSSSSCFEWISTIYRYRETRLQAKCGAMNTRGNQDTHNGMMVMMMMEEEEEDESNPQQGAASMSSSAPASSAPKTSQSPETIHQTAKVLEQLLYQQSQLNLKHYQDISTLDARLRDLMTILVRRRMMKRASSGSGSGSGSGGRGRMVGNVAGGKTSFRSGGGSIRSTTAANTKLQSKAMRRLVAAQQQRGSHTTTSPRSFVPSPNTTTTTTSTASCSSPSKNSNDKEPSARTQRLLQILGTNRYREIQQLIQDIQLVKIKKVATFCGAQQCRRDGCDAALPRRPAFDTQLPSVVKQLYFQTPLLDYFQTWPLERLDHVPWDTLVAQAQSNLLAYQLWEMQLASGTATHSPNTNTKNNNNKDCRVCEF